MRAKFLFWGELTLSVIWMYNAIGFIIFVSKTQQGFTVIWKPVFFFLSMNFYNNRGCQNHSLRICLSESNSSKLGLENRFNCCLPLSALMQVGFRDLLHLSFDLVQLLFYQLSVSLRSVSHWCCTAGFWAVLFLSMVLTGTHIWGNMTCLA